MISFEDVKTFSEVKLPENIGKDLEETFNEWKKKEEKIKYYEVYVYVYKEGKIIFEGNKCEFFTSRELNEDPSFIVELVEKGIKYKEFCKEVNFLAKEVDILFSTMKGVVYSQIIKHLGSEFKKNNVEKMDLVWRLLKTECEEYKTTFDIKDFIWHFFVYCEILI